jgi:hypothetical protein
MSAPERLDVALSLHPGRARGIFVVGGMLRRTFSPMLAPSDSGGRGDLEFSASGRHLTVVPRE